jgi:hypothetical protein
LASIIGNKFQSLKALYKYKKIPGTEGREHEIGLERLWTEQLLELHYSIFSQLLDLSV